MAKQWNSPTELNTFTTEQGRKLKRSRLTQEQRNRFVVRYVETHTAARKNTLAALHQQIWAILQAADAAMLGLTPEYIQALPKGLLPTVDSLNVRADSAAPNDPSASKCLSSYVRMCFPKQAVSWNLYTETNYISSCSMLLPGLAPAKKKALHDLLQQCAAFDRDVTALKRLVETKVEGCSKITDLLTQFLTAECFMDASFYQGEPATPAELVPAAVFDAALSKFLV